ncbi:hypothetical protein ACHAWF_007479 [Thalassiosira exigua]
MVLSPALVFAALAQCSFAAFVPSGALAPSFQSPRTVPSTLSYSNSNGESDGGPMFSPPPLWRQNRQARQSQQSLEPGQQPTRARPSGPRRIPRRAVPHVQNSRTEAAIRAGYIIPHSESTSADIEAGNSAKNRLGRNRNRETSRGVRPLRSIRRIVHRERPNRPPSPELEVEQDHIAIQATKNCVDVRVRNSPRILRSSILKGAQLDEERMPPGEVDQNGARRVTFKATRKSSKAILSKPVASLAEYMTQPVSQYSVLSFHDAEESSSISGSEDKTSLDPTPRRWQVRRLTTEEAQRYISTSVCVEEEVMDESNLFRLAVPLLPLIGWDLTPVIDLEVIPPEPIYDDDANYREAASDSSHGDQSLPQGNNKWAPLKGIRERMQNNGDNSPEGNIGDGPSVVKIRSLRVSLLSNQEEVKEVMTNRQPNRNRGGTMQKEAIEMVEKVEDWLRPHIHFEAELSWNDDVINGSARYDSASTVTVKSTAITSLTIPKIPSDILRATVPSAFLVKRLGATLTSRALAICLPRFLNQLEKDYVRWSGLGPSSNSMEKKFD